MALNVRDALREVPVKQLIFLSSLQAPPHEQSDHLRARQATADILREAGVPVTEPWPELSLAQVQQRSKSCAIWSTICQC